jgi:hypothetical protein
MTVKPQSSRQNWGGGDLQRRSNGNARGIVWDSGRPEKS